MANKPKKTRAAGSAGRGTAANAAKEKPISVQIVADIAEGTPAHYANFIEVIYTKWDFSLIMARIPAKHSAKKIIDLQSTGILSVTADVTITFPPTLVAALIRALTVQKEAYERETNAELKETGE